MVRVIVRAIVRVMVRVMVRGEVSEGGGVQPRPCLLKCPLISSYTDFEPVVSGSWAPG